MCGNASAHNRDAAGSKSAWFRRISDKGPDAKNFMIIVDRIALILAIIGGLNWGSVGLFRFDVVAWLCGGQTAMLSRIIYVVVAVAALWCVSLLVRERNEVVETAPHKA